MPTYQYACTACDERLEVVQKFTDDALTECPACGGRLRKVFSAAGIIFKGSGFYRTDSRAPAKSGANGAGKKDEPAKSSDSGSESAKTSDSASAKKPAESSSSSTSSSSSSEKVA